MSDKSKTEGKITLKSSNLTKREEGNPAQLGLDISALAKAIVPAQKVTRVIRTEGLVHEKVIESGVLDPQGRDVGLIARIWENKDGTFSSQMMPARAGQPKGTAPIMDHKDMEAAAASLTVRTKTNLAYIRAVAKKAGGVYKTPADLKAEKAKADWAAAQATLTQAS